VIGRLSGVLYQVRPGEVVIDAGGAGYLVQTTLRAFHDLAQAERAALWIHTVVRADAIILFGFLEREELEAFQRLISVAGVGPKTALALLSSLSPRDLAAAVEAGDTSALQRIPGVGRKTADRLLLELKDRLATGGTGLPNTRQDAVSALLNLGYSARDAQRSVDEAAQEGGDLAATIRGALQLLARP